MTEIPNSDNFQMLPLGGRTLAPAVCPRLSRHADVIPRSLTMISSEKKKRTISIEMKHEIIDKHEHGVRVSDLAKQYDRPASTISTMLKQKDAIKAVKPTKGMTIL